MKPESWIKVIVGAFAVAIVAIMLTLVVAVNEMDKRDMFSQSDFPCQEDEYLGFVVSPTNDRTGCIHIDDIGCEVITRSTHDNVEGHGTYVSRTQYIGNCSSVPPVY